MSKTWYTTLLTFTVLAACAFAFLYFRTDSRLQAEKASFNERVDVLQHANRIRLDSLQAELHGRDTVISRLVAAHLLLAARKTAIQKQFNDVRNEIINTVDSGQSAITQRLLADYRARFERTEHQAGSRP